MANNKNVVKIETSKKMRKITNIDDLLDHMIGVLCDLSDKKIDLEEASISAKCSENISSLVKTKIAYNHMLDRKETIKFLEPKRNEDA